MISINDLTFVVIDVETTGMPVKDGHKIVEVGAVKIRNGKIVDEEKFSTLINPDRNMDMASVLVTGITDTELLSAPKMDEVCGDLIEFLEEVDYLVAHNAEFDKSFLELEISHADPFYTLPEFLCTKELSKFVYPHEKYHNLDVVLQRAGLIFEGARHRAYEDALFTAKAFLDLLEKSPEKDFEKLAKTIKV